MKWNEIRLLAILMMCAAALAACGSSSEDSQADAGISGEIVEGLRLLVFDPVAEDQHYRVYRGDYIRPELPTGEACELTIPELDVTLNLPVPANQRNYFKVPDPGSYAFTLKTAGGVGSGVIEAVEYQASSYTEVSAQEAAAFIASDDPFILDVRTQGEFASGHIEGATLIPIQQLQARLGELEPYKDRPVFIYCRSGNRSTVAGKALIDAGFGQVVNLRRGIAEWHRAGLPIVK